MITAAAALAVLVMTLTGLALFRRLSRYLCAPGDLPAESDLLLIGVLPGLAIVGGVAAVLAALHLFRLSVIAPLTLVALIALRRDLFALTAGFGQAVATAVALLRRGNLFPVLAFGAAAVILVLGLLLGTLPPENIDVWVYHIPLAQSFIAHHGFAVRQLPFTVFYSNLPSLFELLFATAMMAVPNFIAANAVNLAITFGFVLLLLSFARRGRDIQFLMVCYIFFQWENFLLGTAQPMTDMPRACFSAAAFLFAYRYAQSLARFDLTICALLAGAAVAGKYTELITPLFIGLVLLPLILRHRLWAHLLPAAIAFIAVSFVWYVKNTVLTGNPIFPFVFGHRGLSDEWMATYMKDLSQPFDVSDRGYSTNLLSLKGWQDFAAVLKHYFRSLQPFALVALGGLALPRRRYWVLPLWCVMLAVFWYAVMFNGTRWAISALLVLLSTAFITWFWIADRMFEAWNPQWPTMALERAAGWLRRRSRPWTAIASLAAVALLLTGMVRLKQGYGHSMLPNWMDRELASALIRPGRMEDYLARHQPGYPIYRYIGENNMGPVLQPFDNGAIYYVSSDNGGHPNDWILPYTVLPAAYDDLDAFVTRNHLGYFIDQPHLDATRIERLGGESRVALARALIARMKTHASLVLADPRSGMFLYKVLPQKAGP